MEFAQAMTDLKVLLPNVECAEFSWESVGALLVKRYQKNEKERKGALQISDEANPATNNSKTESFFPSLTLNKFFTKQRLRFSVGVCSRNISALNGAQADADGPCEFIDDDLLVRRITVSHSDSPPNPCLQLTGISQLRQLLDTDDVFVFVRMANNSTFYVFGLKQDAVANSALDVKSHEMAINPDDGLTKRDVVFELDKLTSGKQPRQSYPLPKPFVLLAGISGTGKTRFVRTQAKLGPSDGSNYELIPVRPDWHDPSDLLGYVSRIGGIRFVSTPLLRFMAKAWRNAVKNVNGDRLELNDLDKIETFWLCLDEMNLAPVEQYFADFLAIVETRKWEGSVYSCDPLLRIGDLQVSSDVIAELGDTLGFKPDDALWQYFVRGGMPLPPNIIVAGTVNMDETTHGFSRKVIDRAFTLDYGAFFPNNFSEYFVTSNQPVKLTFPRWTYVSKKDLENVPADKDGSKSIAFLERVNSNLRGTAFELAFRALNELLLAVVSFRPTDDIELVSVWDDFLMTKVLPRLEGDSDKLQFNGQESLLTKLNVTIGNELGVEKYQERVDILATRTDKEHSKIKWRSVVALGRMQKLLESQSFTSFWP